MTGGAGRPIVIAGGGTGGHLFPGLAVADALAKRGAACRFVGTSAGIEVRAVPAAGYPLDLLPGAQLRGGGPGRVLRGAGAVVAGLRAARGLLAHVGPRLVIGVGGYASVAVVLAARLARVPVVLLEQNAIPGAANRILGRVAERVCLGFAEAAGRFPAGRTVHTGNPVRTAIVDAARRTRAPGTGLLVVGGSQGAHRLNVAAVEAVPTLVGRLGPRPVLHQTGTADHAWVAARYAEVGVPVRVEPFVTDMGDAYAAAALVIARAGAMSCAELTVMGRPGILVPYPHAADDHQRANAGVLAGAGAAVVVDDAACTGERLASEAAALLGDAAAMAAMAARARALGRPDAAEHVATVCEEVVAGRRT